MDVAAAQKEKVAEMRRKSEAKQSLVSSLKTYNYWNLIISVKANEKRQEQATFSEKGIFVV